MVKKWQLWSIRAVVSGADLKKQFGVDFAEVLCDHLERLPRVKPRERAKYKVIKTMPLNHAEYIALRSERFTKAVDGLVSCAFDEIESLAEEMREAYENTPDSLKEGDVGIRREDAADTLECISRPDIPDGMKEIKEIFIPFKDLSSRAKRAANAVAMLNTAVRAIRTYMSDLESFAEELENLACEVDDVDFPGMYR